MQQFIKLAKILLGFWMQQCNEHSDSLFHYLLICRTNVISGVAVDNVGMDVPIKIVVLRQTVFEIFEELISCRTNEVTNERTIERMNIKWPIPIARNTSAFRLKIVPRSVSVRSNSVEQSAWNFHAKHHSNPSSSTGWPHFAPTVCWGYVKRCTTFSS